MSTHAHRAALHTNALHCVVLPGVFLLRIEGGGILVVVLYRPLFPTYSSTHVLP